MELHDYQKYAVRFIEEHPIAALFLDMGLGKTITTLTAIHNLMFDLFTVRKVLVIAPLRVARDTWAAEIEKWEHLKSLRYSVAVGTEEERLAALNAPADLYIINRENIDWLVNNTKFNYDMVVIDELSSFKSHQSKRFKALMKVRPNVKRIVGLTGTPASNGLMDLWSEFRLLDMGQRLGKFIGQYRNEYFKPDKQNGYIVYSYNPLPDAEERIYEKISDITVSMKAIDHLHMPELLSNEYPVQLSEAERETYKRFKSELILEMQDTEITAANAASLSNKLSQLANGAVYDDTGVVIPIHSRKLDALEDGDILVMAGSIPDVMPQTMYMDIMKHLQGRNLKIVVDATRDLLVNVLPFHPFLIKPNNHELGEIFGVEIRGKEDVVTYAKKLQERGARNVLISMAGDGAVLVAEDGSVYQAQAPKGKLINSVGAGDSMVAGFLAGYLEHGTYDKAFQMGVCTGSASAFSEELATKAEVLDLLEKNQNLF